MKRLRKIISTVGIGLVTIYITYSWCKKNNYKKNMQISNESDKFNKMFHLMDDWINKKIQGKKIEDYLVSKNYRNIAIYGMSYIGQTLVNELENTEICIKYGIDRDAAVCWNEFPIIEPQDVTEEVDVIIVTAISFFNEIKNTLQNNVRCPIISIEEIIDNI